MSVPKGYPPPEVDLDVRKSRLFATCCGVDGFEFEWRDSLALTANRLRDLHPDAWQAYVDKYGLDAATLRRVYGVE